ncbi:hypothetical protein D3C72_615970 [compost metagenome]
MSVMELLFVFTKTGQRKVKLIIQKVNYMATIYSMIMLEIYRVLTLIQWKKLTVRSMNTIMVRF